ncbi:DNA replication and repair protein RecF [Ephemeroptericola cinctiostellae]|uniref:DNA replication and repair protein RecF n=1 Tax=Ephemeroptericola cinctiostellae TaxID=2268024 RepID=A0A345DCZ5_9BURK|nr:AAA family ATPase [Ephemeroptericola cinctiostellae]AXF86233.1 DNA replication and repair protein RecF [Ephemeroptericola cinctiostellae]
MSQEQEAANEVLTLEAEVNKFSNELPYWGRFLAKKILSDSTISDIDIDIVYQYLLEELTLLPPTEKPNLAINYCGNNSSDYKLDLSFTKLENIEGVNALTENQVIDFSPNLTIIYGANGSGKSGYVRLLKKVFYSKTPEEIIQNIHIKSEHKPVSANFTFHSADSGISLKYPDNSNNSEFEQFAVFDNGSVKKHLDHKNEFEFRPAGLSFFADFTEAIKRVEVKLNSEIASKQTSNEFDVWFDGESEIKALVQGLTAQTNIVDLKKHTPFSEKDKTEKAAIEKKYDEVALASKNKEKDIIKLEGIKKSVSDNKKTIEFINTYFASTYLTRVQTSITDCLDKEAAAKAGGIENFKTNKVQNIGTTEWKNFIVAADKFAKQQKGDETVYPKSNDNCLLCHQPLSEEAENLINNYWVFIKSVVEQNATQSQQELNEIKAGFEKLTFDLFPIDNILTVWLTENYPNFLTSVKENLAAQKVLTSNIVADITGKTANNRVEIQTSVDDHDTIISAINESISTLKNDSLGAELTKLLNTKTYLAHKEKFNIHFEKFTTYIQNQQWILKANTISWVSQKRTITTWEKNLSGKYFNQKYVDIFNQECAHLNGSFGIEVSHTGSSGTSFRQLTLKGKNPAAILSEGEQKVIALADFMAEMQLSDVNRGVIFDDPVTSLDEGRKKDIAHRLIKESGRKQVIVFTHDLIFVSNLITFSEECTNPFLCHWVENRDGNAGQVWLKNSPSYEKEYRNAEPARKHYTDANKDDCPPAQREFLVRTGFTALRTCYEVLVINDLFKNVVQRYNERVSVDALSKVFFDDELVNELLDSFAQCCRYMEGHTHSDKYAYKKPEPTNLNEEIIRYDTIRTKIKKTTKPTA